MSCLYSPTSWKHPSRYFLISALCVSIAACSTQKEPEPEAEPKELKVKNSSTVEGTEESLFRRGQQSFASGYFVLAKDTFTALINNYPNSAYADYAAIKVADSDYEISEFEKAGQGYEAFFSEHPASRSAPYALYRAARSYQLAYHGIGRDLSQLKKALALYDRLLKERPDCPYVDMATQRRAESQKLMAEHDRSVIEFYKKMELTGAAAAREAAYKETWEPLLAEPKQPITIIAAHHKDVEQSPTDETPPSTSPTIVSLSRQSPKDAETPPPAAEQGSGAMMPPTLGRSGITHLTCGTSGNKIVTIGLSLAQWNAPALPREIDPSDGEVHFSLPDTALTSPLASSCYGVKDLVSISTNGDVRIKADKTIKLLSVDNPTRVIIYLP